MTTRTLLFGMLCLTAVEIQGCGGDGGGGSEEEEPRPTDHPAPPKAPGPCECVTHEGWQYHTTYPLDTGSYCDAWYGVYGTQEGFPCEGYPGSNKDKDICDDTFKAEWCGKVWCHVKEDCPLDDVEPALPESILECSGLQGAFWSSQNCEAIETTASP